MRSLVLKAGDTIFFIADKEKQAALYAGQLRNELGQRLDLLEKNAYRFCFINDFPMYEYDEEQKKIIFTHNPFSMPQGGLEALTTKDPLELLAYQYDIVCNGVELSSGAVRNHNLDIMVKAFEIAGYTEEDLKEKVRCTLQCIPVWCTATRRYGSWCRPYDHAASQ